MSCVCVISPTIVTRWPVFAAALTAAATSLGYPVVDARGKPIESALDFESERGVELEVPNSRVITDQLGRDRSLTFRRDNVLVTFSRDERGRAKVCVTGEGHDKERLRQLGTELSERAIQQYVYRRLIDEMRERQFIIVEEDTDHNHAIRLKVRHWEN